MNLVNNLEGEILKKIWKVGKLIENSEFGTGGWSSVCYSVTNIETGSKAFLKAMNYSEIFAEDNFPEKMNVLTSAYVFECKVLERCKDSNLDKIVMALDKGEFRKKGYFIPVNYLIFELAKGNIRQFIDFDKEISTSFILKTLHDTFVGISQLHSKNIVHQDIKPSNILMFENKNSKIADLGRAGMFGFEPPHEKLDIAGDHGYAPIELLYGYIHPDWHIRRKGGDLYALGSLIYFYFNNVSLTCEIISKLPSNLTYEEYNGSYESVIPSIRHAMGNIFVDFKENYNDHLGSELANMIMQLCDPEVEKRGHPLNKTGSQNKYSLERYISHLDLLVKKTKINAWRSYEY